MENRVFKPSHRDLAGSFLRLRCAANGAVRLRLDTPGCTWVAPALPWAVPLPDASIEYIHARVAADTPANMSDQLYRELGRLAAGTLVVRTHRPPIDSHGNFPFDKSLCLQRIEFDLITGMGQFIFAVQR